MTNSNPQPSSRRRSSSSDSEPFLLSDAPTDASNAAQPTPHQPFLSLHNVESGYGPAAAPFEPAALIEVGQVVAERYEITKELGEGGMGLVFQADDRHMGRHVVLKFIRRELAADQRMVQRLLEEATAAARLQHPHIVAIFDRGRDVLGDFLAMEYVDGPNLWELLTQSRGKLPIENAVRYVRQVGSALQSAHEKNILHRDIKPSNVLIDRKNNIAKLADWGLARILDNNGLSSSAAVIGTIDFMAPEVQRKASNASPRSDLYSLAAMLYQLVTGRSPKMMRESLIPEVLREPLLAALEDKPELRPASVTEFLKTLPSTKQLTAFREQAEVTNAANSEPIRPSSPLRPTTATAAPDYADIFRQAHARATELTEQAQAALAEFEYAHAVSLLKQIPEHVRDQALFNEAVTKRDRVLELDEAIRAAAPLMQLDVLRPAVNELMQLQPHRQDLEQLGRQIGQLLAARRAKPSPTSPEPPKPERSTASPQPEQGIDDWESHNKWELRSKRPLSIRERLIRDPSNAKLRIEYLQKRSKSELALDIESAGEAFELKPSETAGALGCSMFVISFVTLGIAIAAIITGRDYVVLPTVSLLAFVIALACVLYANPNRRRRSCARACGPLSGRTLRHTRYENVDEIRKELGLPNRTILSRVFWWQF